MAGLGSGKKVNAGTAGAKGIVNAKCESGNMPKEPSQSGTGLNSGQARNNAMPSAIKVGGLEGFPKEKGGNPPSKM